MYYINGHSVLRGVKKSLFLGQDLKYNLQAAINHAQLEFAVHFAKNLCFQFRWKDAHDTLPGLDEHMLCIFLFQKVS